jgi:hypothetical protein
LDFGRPAAVLAKPGYFNSPATRKESELPVKYVAACDLFETMAYMRKYHPDPDIMRVEFVAPIEIVSGSPLT